MIKRANLRLMAVTILVVLMVCGLAWAGWTEPVPILEVNTEFNDKLPFLSFDGLSLYFVRANTNSFYFARIYEAKREEAFGQFTSVNEISELNYSGGHVTGPWISPDNLRMYYSRTEPGSHWRLKFSERGSINDPWPTGNNVSELNVLGDLFDPALTENELIIFFGVWGANQGELYIGSRANTSSPFSNIRKLTEINSSYHDGGPYISPDGLTLYFHSNRNGVSQLFKAARGSLMDPFGETQHLSVFDTPGGQSSWPALSSDGSALYFTRSFGSGGDIYVSYMADLTELEIVGPNEVAENSQVQYQAIAHYDNNSTVDVTDLAEWSVEPNDNCSITAGLLTTEPIDLPLDLTIYAEYSEDGNSVEAEKDVSIFAICPSGSALEFDGENDYVNIADDSSLQLPSNLTVEAWVKPIYDGGDYYADAIIVKGENVGWGPHFNYRIAMENSNLYTWGVCKSSQELFFHGGTPEYNKWQHLALTADGSICRAYINGVEVASRNAPGPYLTFPGYPLQIGGHGVTGARWFSGLVDEVRIWKAARTQQEIKANMHIPLAGTEPNLVAYWDFDEGEGQSTADSSGNGNDGTLGSSSGVDDSDPNWIDSDAPVGICSFEGLVERNLLRVYDMKQSILDILAEAMATEEATKYFMDEGLKNGNYGDLKKGDVVKAKQKIHSAIQREEQAETTIGQSLEKLNDALDALDIN